MHSLIFYEHVHSASRLCLQQHSITCVYTLVASAHTPLFPAWKLSSQHSILNSHMIYLHTSVCCKTIHGESGFLAIAVREQTICWCVISIPVFYVSFSTAPHGTIPPVSGACSNVWILMRLVLGLPPGVYWAVSQTPSCKSDLKNLSGKVEVGQEQ